MTRRSRALAHDRGTVMRPMTLRSIVMVPVLVALLGGGAAGKAATVPASYDIELRFTGISGHHVLKAADCSDTVSATGYDLMVGTVTGDETSATDEPVVYEGTLNRTTAMDFCELKEIRPGENVDCAATLTGSATMAVSLEVYGEADRGAWLKAKPAIAAHREAVSGRCAPPVMAEILNAYPGPGQGAGGGGSPDGQPIEDQFSQPAPLVAGAGPRFFFRNQARLRVGFYPPDPAVSSWSLWVKRKLP